MMLIMIMLTMEIAGRPSHLKVSATPRPRSPLNPSYLRWHLPWTGPTLRPCEDCNSGDNGGQLKLEMLFRAQS